MTNGSENRTDAPARGLSTVVDFVRWAASRFGAAGLHFGHGTDNPIDEALQLVAHGLHLPLPMPPEFFQAALTLVERETVTDLVRRRIDERKPVAYLTGEAWFAGLAFSVDERVLVPRSPIAELIENRFSPWIDPDRIHAVLDLCTGSGCIGIASACHIPHARVDITDISEDALVVARDNIRRHELAGRVRAIRADVYDGLGKSRYDVIVSNPPYVPRREYDSLPDEYRHEPELGLVADDDGLAVVKRIVRGATGHLEPGGILVVEVGNGEVAVAEAFAGLPLTWLDFARGGAGVFLLTREELEAAGSDME
jgi:ribosomal protein L3 glutamine methyltransferase